MATTFQTLADGNNIADNMQYLGSAWKKERNKFNRAQEELQRWQLQTDYENEYNSPLNQLNRLYEAQINPLFGSDFSNSSSSPSLTPFSESSAPIDYLPQLGANLKDIAQLGLNADLANSQIKLNESAGALNTAQARKAGADAHISEIRSKTEMDARLAEINNLLASGELTKEQRNKVRTDIMQSWQYLANDSQQTYNGFLQAVSSIGNMQTNAYNAVTDRMNAQTNAYNAQTQRGLLGLEMKQFEQAVKEFHWKQAGDILDKAVSKTMLGNSVSSYSLQNIAYAFQTCQNAFAKGLPINVDSPFFNAGAAGDALGSFNHEMLNELQSAANVLEKLKTFGNKIINDIKWNIKTGKFQDGVDEFLHPDPLDRIQKSE